MGRLHLVVGTRYEREGRTCVVVQVLWDGRLVVEDQSGAAGGAGDPAVAGHRGAGEYAGGAGGVSGVLGGAGGDPAAVVVVPPDGVPAAPGPVAPTVRGVRGAAAANSGAGQLRTVRRRDRSHADARDRGGRPCPLVWQYVADPLLCEVQAASE